LDVIGSIKTFLNTHKALIGALAAALLAAAPAVPAPYNAILTGVATVLGAVAGGQYAVRAALRPSA
jgi:hypothetical protein